MGLFDFFRKEDKVANVPDRPPRSRGLVDLSGYLGVFSPYTCSGNFIEAFETMGEVFFPVDFLASRIAGGNYQLKLAKDDSVVFNNEEMNRFFSNPNPLFSFEDLVKMFFVYKYVTGNGFWQASPSVGGIKPKELWKWCDTYWVLPSDQVVINSPMSIPLFQPSTKEDIINSYRISTNSGLMDIDPSLVIHYKDINMRLNSSYLKGRSRLETQRYPIANLVAVYEARNVIYVKRGALGLLISKKYDADGSLPLTDKEKRNIRKEWNDNYGLTNDRSQMSIVDVPTEFVRINMSIQELMPFEETLADAIQIAGIYGIPSVLIPRKDMAKYDNQDIAEISVYSNIVIPEARKFCRSMTSFLGLDKSGMYIDVDFSGVSVLQVRDKDMVEKRRIVSEKCQKEFVGGVLTLNDWRAQIGESKVGNPLYDKLVYDMSTEELALVKEIISLARSGGPSRSVSSSSGGTSDNKKPSDEGDDDRGDVDDDKK